MADISTNIDRRMSSSAELSSPPPKSPDSPETLDSIIVASPTAPPAAPFVQQEPPAKPKRVRKPKLAADGTEIVPKVRKPRAKKKDAEQAASSATTASTSRTKASTGPKAAVKPSSKSSKQPGIQEFINSAAETSAKPLQTQNSVVQPQSDQIGIKNEAIQNYIIPTESKTQFDVVPSPPSAPQQQNLPAQRPSSVVQPKTEFFPSSSSRGQNYDPIRSSTITTPRSIPITNPSTPIQISPIRPLSGASTSPSIASLINPPSTTHNFLPERPSSTPSVTNHLPAQLTQSSSSALAQVSPQPLPVPVVQLSTPPVQAHDLMDIDAKSVALSREPSISNTSTTSAKPDRPKDKQLIAKPKLPPLPGQGLSTSSELGTRAIIIDIPLHGEPYKIVNFQQLAVEKYGFDTVFPKLARQKEHLRHVAANAAALEGKRGGITSNDEMSIDGSDNEAELSTGSKRKAPNGTDGPIKKKRQMKEDMYDKEDPFVDDSEMAWEEHAAAVKDGFFVYSGLLVQPGTEAKIEKADGSTATKKRARTSKGTTTKTASATKSTKDKFEEKDKIKGEDEKKEPKTAATSTKDNAESKKPKSTIPRKRMTKVEAEAKRAEKERLAKEKAAAAAAATTTSDPLSKPNNGPLPMSTSATTSTAVTSDPTTATAASSALSSAAPTASSTPRPLPAVPSLSSPA